MRETNKGLVPILAIIILAILLVLLSAGSYYLLKSAGKTPGQVVPAGRPFVPVTSPTPVPISGSDELSVIEKELKSTDVGSLDSDFSDLDSSASSL